MGHDIHNIKSAEAVHHIWSSRTCGVDNAENVHIGEHWNEGTDFSQKYQNRNKSSNGEQEYK